MRTLLMIAAVVLSCATVRAEDRFHEGKWEYTSEMEMPGMPAMPQLPPGVKLPPGVQMPQIGPGGMKTNYTRCVTEKEFVPNNDKGRDNCTVTKMDRQGNKVSWEATCQTPNGPTTGKGNATYSGDTMEATMTIKGQDPQAGPFEMNQKIHGRYLGPCS